MTYLLKKIYLLTKIQFVITYVAYNFLKYDFYVYFYRIMEMYCTLS